MTVNEVKGAWKHGTHWVISVWDHKTVTAHGPARIVMVLEEIGDKEGANLVFTTTSGTKVTHMAIELEKLGEAFGKKFQVNIQNLTFKIALQPNTKPNLNLYQSMSMLQKYI